MCPQPLRHGEGRFPPDQIRIPCPPTRQDVARDGMQRRSHAVTAAESFRQTVVRLWPTGPTQPAVDLIPAPGGDTVGPESLFGSDCGAAFVVSGTHAFGRLTTRDDDAATLLALHARLDAQGWDWCQTVATSPDRQWIESGALLRNLDPHVVIDTARFHGQSVILRWDNDGLIPVATRPGVDVGDGTPVPVRIVPALTGCPLRLGANGVCKVFGGPWTSSSMAAALVWRNHRAMLLEAFGCSVCGGEGGTGAVGFVELFTPSREGGWQWGPPMTRAD